MTKSYVDLLIEMSESLRHGFHGSATQMEATQR